MARQVNVGMVRMSGLFVSVPRFCLMVVYFV